jgi:hypothetical protein
MKESMFDLSPTENSNDPELIIKEDAKNKAGNREMKEESAKSSFQEALHLISSGTMSKAEIDRACEEFKIGFGNEKQYQHTAVDTSIVIENISEYVIPECQEACRKFWALNIDTFMCSNYDDKNLYVLLGGLSGENLEIFHEKMDCDDRYYLDEYRDCYGVRVQGMSPESIKSLNELVEVFVMQDVDQVKYKSSEDFLSMQKRQGGEWEVLNDGGLRRKINPELKDLTLMEALKDCNTENLYIKDEDRIYKNQYYLDAHKRYLEFIKNKNKESSELSKD